MTCLSAWPESSCWAGCFLSRESRLQAGSRQSLWESSRLSCPSHDLDSTWFPADMGKQQLYCCGFFLILFPVCAWVVSGKRGRGKSTASLIEIHNGHHNLLRSMTEKGWCLYGSACYLPWTIPPSCDCTCTHYKMESESCHFFENNVNGSGLFFLRWFWKYIGDKDSKVF